jgi:hypothetical protein
MEAPMTKVYLCVCFVAIALASSPICFSKEKNWDQVSSELKEAGQRASHLVKEINASQPKRGDLLLLRQNYDTVKDSYLKWADEAAAVVKHDRDIDLRSQKAQAAKSSLRDFEDFAKHYAEMREEEDKYVMSIDARRTWSGIKRAAKLVKDNWGSIQAVASWIKKHKEEVRKQREEVAKNILESAQWPEFDAIIGG